MALPLLMFMVVSLVLMFFGGREVARARHG
jgi:hypothetical protein